MLLITENENNLLGEYAGFFSRAVAYVLDIVIISLTLLALNVLTWTVLGTILHVTQETCQAAQFGPVRTLTCDITIWSLRAINSLFLPFYFIFLWIFGGQTIGNRIMGIRVVRLNGQRNTLFRSIGRLIGYVICFLTLGLGFFAILVNDRRQGWHDRIAGTVVIYA